MSDNTPYHPPGANVADTGTLEYADLRMFSAGPRIGRLRYFSYSTGMYILVTLIISIMSVFLTSIMAGSPGETAMPLASMVVMLIMGILYIALIALGFLFSIKRLHDLDQTGWLSLLMLIPLVGFIFLLYLLFAPGRSEANRFGNPPPPNSTGVIITAWIFPAVFIIGMLAAIAIPAYNGYIQKAQEMQMQQ